jgi:aminomethyltransferase
LEYMAFEDVDFEQGSVRVCRTGYTGEHGYELLPQWDTATPLFDALLAAVRAVGGEPAGLGARDTLRTEMGYPLHGHELSVDITPLEARCGWAVGWKKEAFRGRDALLAQKEAGAPRTLVGLRAVGRGVLRPELSVLRSGETVGVTTSGTFSPSTKVGIALALLDTSAGVAVGDSVDVDVRGRALACEVVRPPFVEPNVR